MSDNPYKVTVDGGKTFLLVMDAKDNLPAAFALMGTKAEDKVAIRITGGCKGMSLEDKQIMLAYFSNAFLGYKGIAFSGATRSVRDGEIDPMVTDIPGVIASANKGCVALGTLPRTDMMSLQENSRLVLDEYGTCPNPDYHGILIVQNGADGQLDWDGDLPKYFELMDNWQKYAGFKKLGLIAWNGGDITGKEIMTAMRKGWPVMLVEGSGRVTDEIIQKYKNKDSEICALVKDPEKVYIPDTRDYMFLRHALLREKFIK